MIYFVSTVKLNCISVELLGHAVAVCFIFWETTRLFSKVAGNVWGCLNFLCPHKHILSHVFFLILVILVCVKYHFIILICIPVMTNNAKHIFMYILAVWITYLGKYPFRSFSHSLMGFPGGSMVKNLPVMQETQVRPLGQAVPPEKEMATHFNILAWKMLWTQEPGGLQSTCLQKSQRLLGDLITTTHSLMGSIIFLLLSCNVLGILETVCLGTR